MSRRPLGAAARALLAWVVILGLLAVVGYLFSERNARTWSLVQEEGRLLVKKGLFLPIGRSDFKSGDPTLAKVYAPLVPPPGTALPGDRSFDDQAALDRELYDLLSTWSRDDVSSGDPARLERGLGYLERAMDLPALSASQRDRLSALRAESGYYEARRLLEKARAELSDAAEKLRVTAGSSSAHALDAQSLLKELGPAIDAATAAVRAAGPARAPEVAPARPPDARPAGAAAGR